MQAVFLDRDGVISKNRPDHVKSWDEFVFEPGALHALRTLRQYDFITFVVTNQAIVGRGVVSDQQLNEIHARMLLAINAAGGDIAAIRYCPHDDHDGCDCRKPNAGMLRRLAAEWNIDLSQSFMIGDAWTDVAAGNTAGCKTIMVRSGRGAEQLQLSRELHHPVNFVAADLDQAVDWLVQRERVVYTQPERSQPMPQLALSPLQLMEARPAKEIW